MLFCGDIKVKLISLRFGIGRDSVTLQDLEFANAIFIVGGAGIPNFVQSSGL